MSCRAEWQWAVNGAGSPQPAKSRTGTLTKDRRDAGDVDDVGDKGPGGVESSRSTNALSSVLSRWSDLERETTDDHTRRL